MKASRASKKAEADRIAMARRARLDFDELLYRTLRKYQIGGLPESSVGVGKLDVKLSQVYDLIRAGVDQYESAKTA